MYLTIFCCHGPKRMRNILVSMFKLGHGIGVKFETSFLSPTTVLSLKYSAFTVLLSARAVAKQSIVLDNSFLSFKKLLATSSQDDDEIFSANTEIINVLRNQLACSVSEANTVYEKYHKCLNEHHTKIAERILVLLQNGILSSTVKEHFWIITFDTDDLVIRMRLLKRWKFNDPNNGLSILKFPLKTLLSYTFKAESEMLLNNGMNKITYFSSFVECSEKRVCDLFVKYPFMMTVKLKVMKQILSMAKAQDINTEDLLNDLWLFRYRTEVIANRIKVLNEIRAREKCKIIKPWMLRCTEHTFNRYFELREENIAAQGPYSDLKDLLCKELELSSFEVDEMILKHPPLAKISYSKVKDMIDFLKDEGFSSREIYLVPRVLCHKQATLVARLAEMRTINSHMSNLQNLCRNKKDYIAFLNKLSTT